MTGEAIGKILAVDVRSFRLEPGTTLHRGDGICFFDSKGELAGTCINDIQGQQIFPERIENLHPGLPLYRNHDHDFLQQLEKSRTTRRIALHLLFRETDTGFELQVEDEEGNQATVASTFPKALAQKKQQAHASLEKQLTKLGGTDFYCMGFESRLSQAYFLPVSRLNALRREVLEALESSRAQGFTRLSGGPLKNQIPYPEVRLSFLGNVLNRKAEQFYRRHGVREIEPAAESGLAMEGRKVMTTRPCILHELGWCDGKEKSRVPTFPLSLRDEENHRFELKFCCDRCEMEIVTTQDLGSRGI